MVAPKRVDKNQPQIVRHLRDVPGVSVAHTHIIGKGFPDIIVGFRDRNYLIEIKTEKGTLTSDEQEWHETWRGQVNVARTSEEILRLIGAME